MNRWIVSIASLIVSGTIYASPLLNAYVANWDVYAGRPISSMLDQSARLNTVTYAFMYINRNGQLVSSDSYADITLGQLKQFADLPVQNHLLAIGGGGFSGWSSALRNPAAFVKSIQPYVVQYGINGIDIDYEPSLSSNSTTTKQMATLIQAIRAAYPSFLITYTVAAQPGAIKGCGSDFWTKLSQNDVYVQVMNYDNFGSWVKTTALGSSLTQGDAAIQALKQQGISSSRIVLGIPLYATGASGVSKPGLGYTYRRIISTVMKYSALTMLPTYVSANGYIIGAYANDSKGNFYTVEDNVTAQAKAQYVLDNQLGGMFMWELSMDKPVTESTSILATVASVFGL